MLISALGNGVLVRESTWVATTWKVDVAVVCIDEMLECEEGAGVVSIPEVVVWRVVGLVVAGGTEE